jgi:hypothetical protein
VRIPIPDLKEWLDANEAALAKEEAESDFAPRKRQEGLTPKFNLDPDRLDKLKTAQSRLDFAESIRLSHPTSRLSAHKAGNQASRPSSA